MILVLVSGDIGSCHTCENAVESRGERPTGTAWEALLKRGSFSNRKTWAKIIPESGPVFLAGYFYFKP